MFGIFKKAKITTYIVETEVNMPNAYNYNTSNAKVIERILFSKKDEAETCFADITKNIEVNTAQLLRRESYLNSWKKIAVSEKSIKYFKRG